MGQASGPEAGRHDRPQARLAVLRLGSAGLAPSLSPWWGQEWVAAAQAKARRAGNEGAGNTEEGSRCRLC